MKALPNIDASWTLFLDRDGVLNEEKENDYIRNKDEFVFYPNVLQAIEKASKCFGSIILVTNQRGVGRGLMTEEHLREIHAFMLDEIQQTGGRIDGIYYAPSIDKDDFLRKPNIGMGLQAQDDNPNIDFKKSIMVGNNLSDMEFGKRLNMYTVFVETTSNVKSPTDEIDWRYPSLPNFIQSICK
jgi:D-glycero-D-manno-heptose 1,7-bisphosphate phosphatase